MSHQVVQNTRQIRSEQSNRKEQDNKSLIMTSLYIPTSIVVLLCFSGHTDIIYVSKKIKFTDFFFNSVSF